MRSTTRFAVDRTITLDVNGSIQRLRLCATRAGLPPLLVVQGGPALPVLHEVAKFQRLLNLEEDFLVAYWDQRGCGPTAKNDAHSVSWSQQIDDLRSVLRWLHDETKQRVAMLGISIGATLVLQAVEQESVQVKAIIAVSPDLHSVLSDETASVVFEDRASREGGSLRRRVTKLGPPPYVHPAAFQARARLLADLGTIEYGKTFRAELGEMLVGMVRAYGVAGTVTTLRNMTLVQRRLLPEIVSLDLFANPCRVTVPVHCVFGEQDALTSAAMVKQASSAISAPASTVVRVSEAGHMVHFDRPDVVRSIARNLCTSTPSQIGSVRIKTAPVQRRGRGLRRRLAIFADRD
jgi:pimeloyl-ACP methyl ester carboxylesterase